MEDSIGEIRAEKKRQHLWLLIRRVSQMLNELNEKIVWNGNGREELRVKTLFCNRILYNYQIENWR